MRPHVPSTRPAIRHLSSLTGHGQQEDYRRSQEAGIDDHLLKPVDLDVLQKMLAHPESLVS